MTRKAMEKPTLIYLDHNATTPTRPEVVEAMTQCMREAYANPASAHRAGQQARRILEDARERIATLLDCDLAAPRRDRLVFTSGGTEANNLAILGMARAMTKDAPGQIIISSGEHQSVIEPAEHLLEQGWRLDTLGLTREGVVRVEDLRMLLNSPPLPLGEGSGVRAASVETDPQNPNVSRLVSVQLANHETGVLQPVAELAEICNRSGVPLHTDAIQVVGKLPVSFRRLGAAAMSLTAHKFGGPLGIGALVLREDVVIEPLMFGGHQQSGLRPGTESAALAVGMATALELCRQEQEEEARRLNSLRRRLESRLLAALPNIVVHGGDAEKLPQTSNIAFPDIDGQILLMTLDLAGVACSVGSACSSGSTELSPTLRAMNLPNPWVASSLRFSVGHTTTEAEIDEAVRRITQVCKEVRG